MTLAVGMVPMILFIVISGQVITEHSVETNTESVTNSKGNIFEATAAMDHVITYRNNHRALNNYSEPPIGDQISKSDVKSRLSEAASYLQDQQLLNFPIQYRVKVTMPDGDSFNVSSSSTNKIYIQREAYVAAPQKEPLRVTTKISE